MTYVGNVQFEKVSEPIWSTEAHGMDQAILPYRGAAPLKPDFEATLVNFAQLADHPRMYLVGYSDDGDPIFPTVDLRFIGVRGAIPPVKLVNSTVLQTVSTSGMVQGKDSEGADIEVQASMEATYYASRTTYQWIEDKIPALTPRYATVIAAVSPRPVGYRISAPGTASGTVNYSAFVTLLNTLRQEERVTDYTREEVVPGKLWACESTVDYILSGS